MSLTIGRVLSIEELTDGRRSHDALACVDSPKAEVGSALRWAGGGADTDADADADARAGQHRVSTAQRRGMDKAYSEYSRLLESDSEVLHGAFCPEAPHNNEFFCCCEEYPRLPRQPHP